MRRDEMTFTSADEAAELIKRVARSEKPGLAPDTAVETHDAMARRVMAANEQNNGSLDDWKIPEKKLDDALAQPNFPEVAPSLPEVKDGSGPRLSRDAADAFRRRSSERVVPLGMGQTIIEVDSTQEHLVETPEQATARLAKLREGERQREAVEVRARMEENIERTRTEGMSEKMMPEKERERMEEGLSFLKQQIADTESEVQQKTADITHLTESILAQKDAVLQSAQRNVLKVFEQERGVLVDELALLNRGLVKKQEDYQKLFGS